MPTTPTLTRAQFIKQPCATPCTDKSKIVDVHFNPVSLQYAITNTMSNQGNSTSSRQHVSSSSGKLTMDLIFDTTHSGEDVRSRTKKIAAFMDPDDDDVPPVVKFKWGIFIFQGMLEKYKETIDYFSASGVPLRASINLTMASQDTVFPLEASGDEAGNIVKANKKQVNLKPPFKPPVSPSAGNPASGSGSGAGAGLGAGLGGALGGSLSAGVGAGVNAGVGIGVSASASIGASAGFGAGVSLGGSAGLSASMSAGVSASNGAFAGLRTSIGAPITPPVIKATANLTTSQSFGVGSSASFGVGGQAQIGGSLSMKADVGESGSLQSRIQFDDV
ncbi:MAG: hypothetical protein OEX07_05665 [Gammaproteobacteria bacterium]|nr:hypothetical protein [Gammaproteobacteria bacterium]